MVLLLVLIIVMTVCGGFTAIFPFRFTMAIPYEPIQRKVLENDLSSNSVNEIYNTYYTVADKKEEHLNVISQIQQVDLNKIKYRHFYDVNGEPYLLVKTMRHRNKRYSSYLTLCPFKICNMGRKRTRTRRYIHLIRATDDNEEA